MVLLAAAAFDPEQNWVRLRTLPNDRRAKLVENIKKFDLLYSRQQQDLSESSTAGSTTSGGVSHHYLDVLNRYHNWLNQLPENKQDELSALPPADRMAAVKKLIADYPLPKPMTSQFLQAVDLGEYSPFELASLFMIWQADAGEAARDRANARNPETARCDEQGGRSQEHSSRGQAFPISTRQAHQQFEEFARTNKRPMLLSRPSCARKKKGSRPS